MFDTVPATAVFLDLCLVLSLYIPVLVQIQFIENQNVCTTSVLDF